MRKAFWFFLIVSIWVQLLTSCDADSYAAERGSYDPYIDYVGMSTIDSDSFIYNEPMPEVVDDQAETDVPIIAEITEAVTVTEAEYTTTLTVSEAEIVTENYDVTETVTAETTAVTASVASAQDTSVSVVINTSSGKYHLDENCSGVKNMKPENRLDRRFQSIDVILAAGYTPCGICSKDDSGETSASVTYETVLGGNAILNTNSKKIHTDTACRYANQIKPQNRRDVILDQTLAEELLANGYSYCKNCS